jgi:hypothetical protein
VPSAVPLLGPLRIDKSEVGFVDQGRGLERLAGLFVGQFLRRQLAQLVVNQRQELLGGVRVAGVDGGQDTRNVGHSDQCTALELARLSTATGVLRAPVSSTEASAGTCGAALLAGASRAI